MNAQPEISHDLDPLQVARFILHLDAQRPKPDVTQMKLHKLLYLVQANYLAATGWRLLDDDIEAFEHGPVVHSVRREYSWCKHRVIAPSLNAWAAPDLPEDARAFVAKVWAAYKDWSASALRNLTHDQAPWEDAYEKDVFRKRIPDSAMRDFFRYHVPSAQRVMHPDVVVVDQAFLDELDDNEDEIVAQALAALR